MTVPNQNTTSPERVVEILERISDAFVALDRNSCYTYMNKKASEIFNRDPQQMIGKYIWAEFPESSGQPIHLAYEKAMKEQQYVYLEEYFAPNHQWFENHIYPSPEGLSIFFRDITEKKKTEEKLEQSQKRFRALVENNEGIISLVDEKLNVLFRSESAARITGWTNAEIEKTNAAEYIHPDDLEGLKSTMTKAMQKAGENIPIEIRVRHKKGNYICLEGVVKNMTHDPAIGGIITNMRDITEKKKTEEELNKNHAFIESIINASPDIIYIYDIEERKNVFSNDGIQTNLGYTIAEIKEMGHQILPTLMPKEDFDHYLNNTYPQYATLKDKEVLIHEFRMKHKDGSWHWLQTKESVFLRKPDGMPKQIFGIITDITDRKKDEEKLKESEERYRNFIEGTHELVQSVDPDGKFIFVNKAWEQTLGYSEAERAKLRLIDIIHPGSRAHCGELFRHILAGHSVDSIEVVFLKKNGDLAILEGNSFPRIINGEVVATQSFFRDVTEKKKDEVELKEKGNFIESIINASPDIIYIYDIEERKNVFSNDGIQTNLGYTIAEIKEMGHQILPTLMPKEDFDHYLNNTYPQYATLKDKEVLIHEFRMKHKDGSWHWLQTKESVFLRKPDGMPKQIFGITTDITDRKKDEEKLKESEERYRELIEQAADGIILVDENTNIIMANRSMCEMLGYSREEILTLKITDTYPESERHMAAVRLKMAEQTSPLRIERLMLRKNGTTIPVEAIISKTSQGVFQSIVRDITDRKKTEEQLLLSKERFIKIFEKTPYAATLTKADTGIIEEVNEAFERSFGYSRHELIGKTSAEIQFYQTTEDREKMTLLFKQNGFIHNTEVKLFTKVNESRVFIINSDIVDIVGQKYILTVAEDVTEKKKGEEKLQKSEELFSSVFYTSPAGILITRIDDGKIINANDAFLNMFELSREETIGHNSIELNMLSPEERTKLIQQQIISGGLNNFELLSKTRSGKPIYLLFSSRPLEINDEACHITSLIDISERKKAEEALKQSENALKEAQRIAHVGSWVNDLATGKQTWSDETYNIFGVSPENFSLDLDSFFQCIHPDDRALVKESMKSAMAGDPSPEIEYRIVLPDKSIRYLSGRGELKYDEQNKLVLMSGTVQDITERIKAEEEINQTTEQLRQLASHLQTIREEERKRIGREIHDELGQQLTAIKMDLVWVDKKIPREETLLKDKLDNSISLLDQSNLSIRKILNELRMGVLEHTELVDAMLLHAEQFTKNTGIPVEFNISNEQIQGDDIAVACLFRVFQESLTNITRYSEAKKVTVSLKYNEEAIYLSIKDDGKGFDTALLKNKRSFGILGMRERVAALKGKFDLQSFPGKGTWIEIMLPKHNHDSNQ